MENGKDQGTKIKFALSLGGLTTAIQKTLYKERLLDCENGSPRIEDASLD
jgi:hypothetical protein